MRKLLRHDDAKEGQRGYPCQFLPTQLIEDESAGATHSRARNHVRSDSRADAEVKADYCRQCHLPILHRQLALRLERWIYHDENDDLGHQPEHC